MADLSFLERIEGAVAIGITALVGWIWTSTHKRISDAEKKVAELEVRMLQDTVSKHDFSAYEARAEQSRSELRDNVVHIYNKIDELKMLLLKNMHNGGKD